LAEEDFEPRYGVLEAYSQRVITGGLMAGLAAYLMDYQTYEVPPGGTLDGGDVPGSQGGISSGLGVMVTYDTRHPRFSAHRGNYLQVKTLMFRKALGSEYHFNRTTVDLRHYKPLGKTMVLAMQGYAQFTRGIVPFYMMPLLGGKYAMRGYFYGRFRDNEMITGQAELRYPLWKRFRGWSLPGPDPSLRPWTSSHGRDLNQAWGWVSGTFSTYGKILSCGWISASGKTGTMGFIS